jgi:hypothetical protein
MADPVSVLALLGLVYTGKKLAEQPVVARQEKYKSPDAAVETVNLNTDFKINMRERELTSPTVTNFGDIVPQARSSGGEVIDMKDRFVADLNIHNNLSSIPKQQVGPGLGVAADVPAVGGYQQMFRALPENVGAYRLTTLPGRSGPAFDHKGGRGQLKQTVGHNRPEKTAFLPDRRPTVRGRAQGQGGTLNGVTGRQSYEKTKRTTNRSETGLRTDGLEFNPGKRLVPHGTISDRPTRNKTDVSDAQFKFMDNISPGISSFYGAYENDVAFRASGSQIRSSEELSKYGFRLSDRRSQPVEYYTNRGRMNVRGNPLQAQGMITSVRSDNNRMDGYTGPMSAGWMQDYVRPQYQDLNPYKGKENNLDLDVAKRQLRDNPLAHSLSN